MGKIRMTRRSNKNFTFALATDECVLGYVMLLTYFDPDAILSIANDLNKAAGVILAAVFNAVAMTYPFSIF